MQGPDLPFHGSVGSLCSNGNVGSARTCRCCGMLHVCMQVRIAVVGGGTGEILEAAGVKPAFTATKVRYRMLTIGDGIVFYHFTRAACFG